MQKDSDKYISDNEKGKVAFRLCSGWQLALWRMRQTYFNGESSAGTKNYKTNL